MINIYFKPCCHDCNNLDPEYEQASGPGELITVFNCRHACVCGKYRDDHSDEESPPPRM